MACGLIAAASVITKRTFKAGALGYGCGSVVECSPRIYHARDPTPIHCKSKQNGRCLLSVTQWGGLEPHMDSISYKIARRKEILSISLQRNDKCLKRELSPLLELYTIYTCIATSRGTP